MNGLNGIHGHVKRMEERAPKQQPELFFSFEHVPPEVMSAFYEFYESLSEKIDEEAERPFRDLSDDEVERLDEWVGRLARYG